MLAIPPSSSPLSISTPHQTKPSPLSPPSHPYKNLPHFILSLPTYPSCLPPLVFRSFTPPSPLLVLGRKEKATSVGGEEGLSCNPPPFQKGGARKNPTPSLKGQSWSLSLLPPLAVRAKENPQMENKQGKDGGGREGEKSVAAAWYVFGIRGGGGRVLFCAKAPGEVLIIFPTILLPL